MKTRTWMLIGALLALPALSVAVEPAPQAAAAQPSRPALNLQAAEVQKIIRAAAKTQIETQPLAGGAKPFDDAQHVELGSQTMIPFRAPRRPHHLACDSFNCVAYTADDVALYTIPREQYYGEAKTGDAARDEWLGCQSHDDLLTTFQRYDKCRGITIGLPPVTLGNVQIAAPGLRF